MPEQNQLAVASKVRVSSELALSLGMEVSSMLDTIKAQCFKCPANQVTDAQLAAFVSIAHDMEVNPLLPGMLYAYPIQGGGIVPIMGPDGVFKKLSERSDIDSWETKVYPEDPTQPVTHATTQIWIRERNKPLTYTAYFAEWKINSNPNWNTRPRHMLFIRATKQCARQIIHGIPFDEDERHIMGEINVTPSAETPAGDPANGSAVPAESTAPRRGRPPGRSTKGVAAVTETPAAPAIDVQATTAGAKPADKPATPTKPEAPATLFPPATTEPVTTLIQGESKSFVGCTVEELIPQNFALAGQASRLGVKAVIDGPFKGTVYDSRAGSAAWIDDKDPTKGVKAMPPWQLDHPVNVTLKGKPRSDGSIACVVEAAELTPTKAEAVSECP